MDNLRLEKGRIPFGHIFHFSEQFIDHSTRRTLDGRCQFVDFTETFSFRAKDLVTAGCLFLELPIGTIQEFIGPSNALLAKTAVFIFLGRKRIEDTIC